MTKRLLLAGTAVVALWSLPVAAQDRSEPTPAQSSPSDTGDVTVVGLRQSNNAAIKTKRDSLNIVDAIGANDVRELPDNTVVEALKRIPGIAIFPTNDNEHTQDEAVTPAIRGLGPAYNNVTVDGLAVASPGTPNGIIGNISRGVRLDILPSSMISQLQVVKTFTADLDPNAVGGAINIVTRSAFENGGAPFLTVDGAAGHATDVGVPHDQRDPGYRFVATGSTTFGPGRQFGVTVSGNYETISNYTVEHATFDTGYYNFYDNAGKLQTGAALGNGIPVPNQDRYWFNPITRTRWGVTAKLEWRPSERFDGFVTGGYYDFKTHYERNEIELSLAPNAQPTVLAQTPTSGSYPTGAVRIGYIDDHIDQATKLIQAGLNWHPADRQSLSVRASASSGSYEEAYPQLKYASGVVRRAPGVTGAGQNGLTDFAFGYDTSRFDFSYDLPSAAFNNLSNYSLLYYRPFVTRQAYDDLYNVRADYAFNQSAADRGFGFGLGVSYSDDSPRYGIDRLEYDPNTTAGPLGFADVQGPAGIPLQYTKGLTLLAVDPAKALAQLTAQPLSGYNLPSQAGFNNQDDFTHHEQTIGAYALASYKTDDVVVQGGLHLDDTHQLTTGKVLANGVYGDLPSRSKYRFWLPSAIATWHVTPALDARAAFSQTIGRPSYDTLAARSSITFTNAGDAGNGGAQGVGVTVGNPNLRPRKSTNYDLSLDWVPSRKYGGIISVAGFYKKIDDEIFTSNTVGYVYGGVNYVNAQVSQPLNSSDASVKGVELNAILNSFAFVHPLLAGIGVSGNVSIYGGRIKVPLSAGGNRQIDGLVDQPGDTENASIFYAQHGLELRAAWNRQGRSLRAIQSDIYWQDLYWAPRDQLDLSASYTLHNGVALFVQAANVTGNRIVSLTGPGKNLLRDDYTVPTTIWAGIRFTPHFR